MPSTNDQSSMAMQKSRLQARYIPQRREEGRSWDRKHSQEEDPEEEEEEDPGEGALKWQKLG